MVARPFTSLPFSIPTSAAAFSSDPGSAIARALASVHRHCDSFGSGHPYFGQSSARHAPRRSEEHTSELQSLMRISYSVFCLKTKHQPLKPNDTVISSYNTHNYY